MQLTIDIPDEQARKLGMAREDLEQLLARLLGQLPRLSFADEIVEFQGRGPQPSEIVDFHASDESQLRIRELLDKNREGTLKTEERAELDAVESLNHLFALIKARAWRHLQSCCS
jgi:hypothetical protein